MGRPPAVSPPGKLRAGQPAKFAGAQKSAWVTGVLAVEWEWRHGRCREGDDIRLNEAIAHEAPDFAHLAFGLHQLGGGARAPEIQHIAKAI